jgi:uncharacterized membrane protein (DUF4010 family)
MNVQTLLKNRSTTITTSICLFLTAQIGTLVGLGHTFTPTAATLMLVAFLSGKEVLVNFSLKLTTQEVRSAITFAIIAFVVYPLLPAGYIDPWKVIDLQSAWLTVILISAIGFANYVLLKLYGSRGVALTGFLGGLVSSTATVMALATMLREKGTGLSQEFLRGIRLANLAMFVRNGLIVSILAYGAAIYTLPPLGLMIIVNLGLTFARGRRKEDSTLTSPDLALDSPFSLRQAFKYGLIFLIITILGELAQRWIGIGGFFLVSFIGGFASSASASATAANLAASGKITFVEAAIGTLLASAASSTIQVYIAAKVGGNSNLTKKLGYETGAILATGVSVLLIQTLFQLA